MKSETIIPAHLLFGLSFCVPHNTVVFVGSECTFVMIEHCSYLIAVMFGVCTNTFDSCLVQVLFAPKDSYPLVLALISLRENAVFLIRSMHHCRIRYITIKAAMSAAFVLFS